ncbi:MAG: DUF1684 domain-containing protein [Calditrichia bacterium]|nr:DUF1684 domain-containing protein [Calditrichia bacterium]
MKRTRFRITCILFLCVIFYFVFIPLACSSSEKIDPVYLQEVDDWHARRLASLTKPDSWLSLAGLFWLKEGENSFGGSDLNRIKFPPDKAPAEMGQFFHREGVVSVQVKNGISVFHDGKIVKTMTMVNDSEGTPTILKYGSLSWYIIKRSEKLGIRLKDSENRQLKNFSGIDRFPVNPKWKIIAKFEEYETPRTIEIPNILGTVSDDPSPGKLIFEFDGQSYSLDPIADPDDKRWFIIFSDQTSGEETYGAGRFLYIDAPVEDGTAIIDFNKAYNPPCVFTPYATCQLPPEQNHLALHVTAGEKNYHGYDH